MGLIMITMMLLFSLLYQSAAHFAGWWERKGYAFLLSGSESSNPMFYLLVAISSSKKMTAIPKDTLKTHESPGFFNLWVASLILAAGQYPQLKTGFLTHWVIWPINQPQDHFLSPVKSGKEGLATPQKRGQIDGLDIKSHDHIPDLGHGPDIPRHCDPWAWWCIANVQSLDHQSKSSFFLWWPRRKL